MGKIRESEKVLKFADQVGRKKFGSKGAYTYEDPEYRILACVMTDEEAEVAMGMAFRIPRSAHEISEITGIDEAICKRCLNELQDKGVCFVNNMEGVDKYWYDTWVPGTMEMVMGSKRNHIPEIQEEIARAFNDYGLVRGPKSSGVFPVGVGLMRVIPIERAIDGDTHAASYEEVSHYIEENTIFCVSDCSCRTVRESLGEGCGHLKEDMCIQMGHAAEYYIRSGKGRQVTKEEVYEILRKAEENGLMHEIPNTDGSGKSHAICNCCGCGCLSLRTGNMFKNNDMIRSNYIAKVDQDKCVACGQCVENCPMNAAQLGQKLKSTKPYVKDITTKITPRDYDWAPENWNEEYRTNRKNVVDSGTAPCKANCPAHIAVQGYIKLAAQGNYRDALELIKKENPFPAICGRICNRRCESACTRGDIDKPVAIDEIKKFIAQLELDAAKRYIPTKRHNYSHKKIGIVGSGPAGLSCAYFLSLDGYSVTVFEKSPILGGMLALGIPSYRLEKEVIEAEIEVLRQMGVDFKVNVEVGKDVTLAELREQGYNAFYVAIGAQGGKKLGIEGEEAEGVMSGIELLRALNLGNEIKLSGKTVVIGGGNVAVDAARSGIRSGATKVDMYCLESEKEMPASLEEQEEAKEEGIEINNGWGPKRIIVENGKAVGVEFKKCLSVFDENHRFNPKYDEADTMIVAADQIIITVGQSIEWGTLLEGSDAEFNQNATIKADAFTYQSDQKDVFVGGDCYSGPKFAIDAIAAGKQGAISLHRFVQNGQSLVLGRDRHEYHELDKESTIFDTYDTAPRQNPTGSMADEAKKTFRDLRGTFTEEQVKLETKRCLGCGAAYIDEYMCVGCGQCTTKCKFDAIKLERKYNGEGVTFNKMKPIVVKNMVKRQTKIAVKKITRVFKKDDE